MKKLSILIPVFNNIKYTKTCIKQLDVLLSAGDLDYVHEIIIVDDNSTDNTSEWIKSNYPDVKILNGNGNLWWSGSINKGIKYAINENKSDFVLFWNNDIIPDEKYFITLSKYINSSNNDSIIGSKIYCSQEDDKVWSMGGIFNPRTGKRYMPGFMEKDNINFQKITKVNWLPGMGTLVPVDIVEEIGYLDNNNFPQYHGDSDYTYRAYKKGYSVIVDPNLVIYNDPENSAPSHDLRLGKLIKSLYSVKSKYNLKKDLIFYSKHANSPLAFSFLFLQYIKYIGGFIKWKLINLVKRKK